MFSVVIATCGDQEWADLAREWARPSVDGQGAHEVLIEHFPELEVAAARNRLAARATGAFTVFLDADDQLCDGYLDAMRDALSRQSDDSPVLLVPAMGLCDPDGTCLTVPSVPDWDRWPDVNCVCIGAAWPTQMLKAVGGFNPCWHAWEDWDLALRLCANGAQLVPVPDSVYCATVHSGSRNRNVQDGQTLYEAIKAQYDWPSIPRNEPLVTA